MFLFLTTIVIVSTFLVVLSFNPSSGRPAPLQIRHLGPPRSFKRDPVFPTTQRPLLYSGTKRVFSRALSSRKDASPLEESNDSLAIGNDVSLIPPIELYLLKVIKGRKIREPRMNTFKSDFDESSFIGNTTHLASLINWAFTVGPKPKYLGTLKGRGMGNQLCVRNCVS